MVDLKERIANLPPDKLAEFLRRLGESSVPDGVGGDEAILRRQGTGACALSFAQERLWFLAQLHPDRASYNISRSLRLKGRLRVGWFQQSVDTLVRRHESLRTNFQAPEGKAQQVIAPHRSQSLPLISLTALPSARAEREARRLAVQGARRPFDLARGSLLRLHILRLSEAEYVIHLTLPHIISDGWSAGILLHEVAELYNARAAGALRQLPALPIQYADFAVWQRRQLDGDGFAAQLAYWRGKLAGAPERLDLPTDRSRPAEAREEVGMVSTDLPAELVRGLVELAEARGATLFMVELAALGWLLSRHANQPEVVIGTPVAGRDRLELEGLVGCFVNTLALRLRPAGEATFLSFLQQVRETTLDAFSHQDLPFEKLVDALGLARSLKTTPLFQVMFAMQSLPANAFELTGLQVVPFEIESGAAPFDLLFNQVERADGEGRLSVQYDRDLFDGATVQRLLHQLKNLLGGILSSPDHPPGEFPILSSAERAQLLVEWNDTIELSHRQGLVGRFEAWVERSPEAVALVSDQGCLSYRQLSQRANGSAGVLRELGIGAEDVVPVLAERGLDFWLAVLGVFKAGGAYLPLDPDHPTGRLVAIVERSGARLVLTHRRRAAELKKALAEAELKGKPRVLLLEEAAGSPIPSVPSLPQHSSQLAYVIFTSGSTGVPKGAMVVHQGMLNHLDAKIADLDLKESDEVAQTASQCFDISVWQFFAPLLVGGKVHLVSDPVAHSPEALSNSLARHPVTVLETVPSLLRLLCDEAETSGLAARSFRALRWLMPTGEALPPDLCRRWLERFPTVPVVNAYGPTECSDDVSHHVIRRPTSENLSTIPIGRPLINLQLYIVDPKGWPVPLGVAGELVVGGLGVGRGYLREPARTAVVFVPDGVGGHFGGRLYRSGDLARWLTDGTLAFLGRIDHQVKVRGLRIELGEIETVLAEHPAVREVVATVSEEGPGRQRLVAYVTPADAESLRQDFKEHLTSRLPEYMVPAEFVFLQEFPRTPNGKLDRKALPALRRREPEPAVHYEAPRTASEKLLARSWTEVLGLERVGIRENFFELGGDSILSIQVVSQARRLGLQVTPREMFEYQTIAELAMVARQSEATQVQKRPSAGPVADFPASDLQAAVLDRLVSEHPTAVDMYTLSPLQEGFLFHSLYAPLSGAYLQQLSCRLEGDLDVPSFLGAWRQLLARHAVLRSSFHWQQLPHPVQMVHRRLTLPLLWVDLSGLPAARAEKEGMALRVPQVDLNQVPTMRLIVLKSNARVHRLLLGYHHIQLDGWSLPLLFRDWFAFYQASLATEEPDLGPPPRYRRYIDWLAEQDLSEERVFWSRELQGFSSPTRLASDRHSDSEEAKVERRELLFSEMKTRALEDFARRHHLTLNSLLQGVWALLLGRYSGESEVVFGVTLSGRSAPVPGIRSMVGVFINTLPLRLQLDAEARLDDWLQEVQRRQIDLQGRESTALRKIQEWSEVPAGMPLFESILVFENYPADRALMGQGARDKLQITRVELSEQTNYPLTLNVLPDRELLIRLEYRCDRFDATTAARKLRHLESLLMEISQGAKQRLGELQMLHLSERQQILREWNDRAAQVSGWELPERFEGRARGLYILDRWGEPVTIGARGELYAAVQGASEGDRDARRMATGWVPNAWSELPGDRIWRTGQVARWRSDGQLEHFGRVDLQAKTRGLRVEPDGEVAAHLELHPLVRQAAVTIRDEGAGEQRLVAYWVAESVERMDSSEFYDFLSERVASTMMPTSFIQLDALPLNQDGQLDLRALPAPALAEGDTAVPPTPIEETVASLWCQVLQVPTVARDDDFFDLGGHSLLAIQLVSRLREACGAEVPLRAVFEVPTLLKFVGEVQRRMESRAGLEVPPVERVSRRRDLELSFSQERLWYLHQLEPEGGAYNVVAAFSVSGKFETRVFHHSLSEIVRRHELLRSVFRLVDDRPAQVILPSFSVRFPVVDLQHLDEEKAEREAHRLTLRESQDPFDLEKGPLLRVTLLDRREERHLLLITAHHIVCDAWSAGIFVRELMVLYSALLEGKEKSPLPELSLQYADFAAWQRRWLRGQVLEEQLSYWRKRLRGAPKALELATDWPRPAVQGYRGESVQLTLGRELGQALRTLSRLHGVTLFMTFLAAFKTLLRALTGQTDLVVGSNVANRNRTEAEPLIGLFINQLALRSNLQGDPTFLKVLAAVRKTVLEAWTFQDLPFEKVVEAVQPERDTSRTPVFQVKFELDVVQPPLKIPGVRLQSLELKVRPVHVDLLLMVEDSGDDLTLSLDYRSDLFRRSTTRRILRQFEALLQAIAARPKAQLSSLDESLEQAERQRRASEGQALQAARLRKLRKVRTRPRIGSVSEEKRDG